MRRKRQRYEELVWFARVFALFVGPGLLITSFLSFAGILEAPNWFNVIGGIGFFVLGVLVIWYVQPWKLYTKDTPWSGRF